MPRILALDIALRTGWAHDGPEPGVPIAGLFRSPETLGDKKRGIERGMTLLHFRRFLISKIGEAKPDIVVFEAPLNVMLIQRHDKRFKTNHETVLLLTQLCGHVEPLCYELDIKCRQAQVQKVRRFFTGTIKGGKEPTQARCRQLGWDFQDDDNVADAMAIWAYSKVKTDPKFAPLSTPLFGRRQTP